MPRRKLYIHVGPHKTGTTTIQRGLVANKAQLEALGYHFPDVCFNYNGHHNLVNDLLGSDDFKEWLGGMPELVDYAQKTDGHMILSSEAFDRIVTKEPWEKLKSGFSDIFDIHIIGYLRPQEELLQSFWKTEVLFLNLLDDFEDWLDRTLVNWPFLQYDHWLDPIYAVFGQDNVRFNIYDPGSDDLFLAFLKQCGLNNFDGIETPERENISLPSQTFELLRHLYINPFIRKNAREDKFIQVMMIGFKNKARIIHQFAKGEGIDLSGSIYSPALLKSVRQRFAPRNKKVARRYYGRDQLFTGAKKLKPRPAPVNKLLTPDQALRLGGKLIEFEQNKKPAQVKKKGGMKIKSKPAD